MSDFPFDYLADFKRNSKAWATSAAGLIREYGVDEYREDFINGRPRGVLIEEASTNHILWNRGVSHVSWIKTGSLTLSPHEGVDGVQDVATLVKTLSVGSTIVQNVPPLAAPLVSVSVYLKRIVGASTAYLIVDGVRVKTIELTDVYERYSVVMNTPVTSVGVEFGIGEYAIDAFQVEENNYPTSIIFTENVPVTREADKLSGKKLNEWMGCGAGRVRIVYEIPQSGEDVDAPLVVFSNADNTSFIEVTVNPQEYTLKIRHRSGNRITPIESFIVPDAEYNVVAFSWMYGILSLSIDGESTKHIYPPLPAKNISKLTIGSMAEQVLSSTDSIYLNGHIHSVAYCPTYIKNLSDIAFNPAMPIFVNVEDIFNNIINYKLPSYLGV